jgi:alkylation response protein AidB-like acyl-CoA dehydrogenase
MDLKIPEELRMVQTTIRKFVETEIIPYEREYHDDFELPDEIRLPLREKVKELGLWNLGVPEEFGGGGLDTLGMFLVETETHKTWLTGRIFDTVVFPAMLFNASDYIKEKYLYPTLNGDLRISVGLSEPGAAGDLAGITTTARRDGDNYVINGAKLWSGWGYRCDYMIFVARMEGTQRREGMTHFIVDRGTPGFVLDRPVPMMGYSETSEFHFENCVVPSVNRLTPEGGGWGFAQGVHLARSRVRNASETLGPAERSLSMAVEYANQRSTFGEPLANRQMVQAKLADSAIDIHAARTMMIDIAWKIDNGQDVRYELSMAKVFVPEMAARVIDKAIQIFGAAGYSKDLPLERLYRDVRAVQILEGPNDVHRWLVARNLLKGYRKVVE